MPPTPSFPAIYAAGMLYRYFRARQDTSNSTVRCLYCTRKRRLLTFQQLKRGDHICMGGEKLKLNLCQKQICIYTHHAIVKRVEFINDAEAMLTMIHFISTAYDKTIHIQETIDMKNLYNDEIYVMKYKHETRSVEDIIERAQTLVGKGLKYSLLSYNCEGFANWCVIGLEESYQAESVLLFIRNLLHNFNNTIIGAVIRRVIKLRILLTTVDDADALTASLASAPAVFGVIALLYLCYCIYEVIVLKIKRDANEMCSSCFSNRHCDIWTRFGSFCVPQLFGYIAIVTISSGATPVLGACSALSLLLMWGLPKLRRKLRSPFTGIRHNIVCLRDIMIGDVVSFSYYGIGHVGIVSSVIVQQNSEDRQGTFKIIHYARRSILQSREIREEEVGINLNKTKLLRHDYSDYDVNTTEEVVARARMRIGERKFGILENRSCHFCHWAKVKETTPMAESNYQEHKVEFLRSLESTDDISNPIEANHMRGAKHATHTLSTNRAIIRDDVAKGTFIQFKYRWCWHKAICTHTQAGDGQSVLIATVVHYGKDQLVKETLTFDLRYDDIYTYNFHPLYRYKSDDVIRRASAKIGERAVRSLDEVNKGDVISFLYSSLRHEAVVTDVIIDDSRSSCETGLIRIVHYALPRCFSTREIMEEDLDIDLSRDKIYINMFAGYTTYPAVRVVERAQSRIGERKYHCVDKTSFDFVHWAKARAKIGEKIYNIFTRRSSHMAEESIHTDKDKLVRCLDEVKKGDVISFLYWSLTHEAVVTDVIIDDSRSSCETGLIRIVHYALSRLFSTREIMEDDLDIDLSSDKIYIQKFAGYTTYPADRVVERARSRIGERKFNCVDNTSFDFVNWAKAIGKRKYNIFTRRSSHLAEEAIHKDKNKLVRSLDEVKKGDVISFLYWSLTHEAVVTDVIIDDSRIRIVHYALPRFFSTREIIEENRDIDLSRDKIYIQMFAGYATYPADRVVERARNRIGERKFHSVDNTSFDFVHWAKVIQQPCVLKITSVGGGTDHVDTGEGDNGKNIVLLPTVGEIVEQFQVDWAKTWDELTPGIIVKIRCHLTWNVGIVSEVDSNHTGNTRVIKVIHCANHFFAKQTIREDSLPVDLQRDWIWVYRCDPRKCHAPDEVVQNAKDILREKKWGSGSRSWDFCKACTLKSCEEFHVALAKTWDELTPGIIVKYWYNLTWNVGIVTDVDPIRDKVMITVIHYGTNHLFAKRTLREDSILVDLSHDLVWVYTCDPGRCHAPDEVVHNAKNRLGEKIWRSANRSWDFCKACTLISCEEFHVDLAKTWDKLTPGIIVKCMYLQTWYVGIVSEVDQSRAMIVVIHYGSNHLLDERTIMEDSLLVDLQHDRVWVYSCDPRKGHAPNVVVQNAKVRLGENEWRSGNRSWDFCKKCTLKPCCRG